MIGSLTRRAEAVVPGALQIGLLTVRHRISIALQRETGQGSEHKRVPRPKTLPITKASVQLLGYVKSPI